MQTPPTNNAYWLLRHGRSKPNEAGIIVSKMENGVKPEHGLADVGKEQAAAAGLLWKQQLGAAPPSSLLIVASPFARTLETAAAAGAAVGVATDDPRFTVDAALRERNFGDYELASHDLYADVWAGDATSTSWAPPGEGGESVDDVSARVAALFEQLEATHAGKNILLVAHGDTLSIATATAKGGPLGGHRGYAQETGELRRLEV